MYLKLPITLPNNLRKASQATRLLTIKPLQPHTSILYLLRLCKLHFRKHGTCAFLIPCILLCGWAMVIDLKPVASFNQGTHIIPWTSLPGISVPYRIWSSVQTFAVNDKIVFVFPQGLHTAAEVTKEGYDKCNLSEIISIEATSPATFTIESVGKHYYICTVAGHCQQGQKVAITVPDSSPALLATSAPRSSSGRDVSGEAVTTHIVGDGFGWAPSSGGASDYKAWASNRTFLVGDTLVFKFVNKLNDVAMVPKSTLENCDTSKSAVAVYKKSPARVILNSPGNYYFTTTNPHMCDFGQQLAINVRGRDH